MIAVAATHIIPMVIDVVLFAIIASMLKILDICCETLWRVLEKRNTLLPEGTRLDG